MARLSNVGMLMLVWIPVIIQYPLLQLLNRTLLFTILRLLFLMVFHSIYIYAILMSNVEEKTFSGIIRINALLISWKTVDYFCRFCCNSQLTSLPGPRRYFLHFISIPLRNKPALKNITTINKNKDEIKGGHFIEYGKDLFLATLVKPYLLSLITSHLFPFDRATLKPIDWLPSLNYVLLGICIYLMLDILYTSLCGFLCLMLNGRYIAISDNPIFSSTSVSQLWGKKWNRYIQGTVSSIGYVPIIKLFGVSPFTRSIGILNVFFLSGVFHEMFAYMISYDYQDDFWRYGVFMNLIFFLIHGLIVIFENVTGLNRIIEGSFGGWVWTILIFWATSPLFVEPYLTSPAAENCLKYLSIFN